MLSRCVKSSAVLATILAGLFIAQAGAETLPSFDKLLTMRGADELTDWGRRYEHGVGVSQDTQKAVKLYCKAAQKGHVAAKYHLGQLFAFGRGIRQDKELAAAWFYQAAKGKDERARGMLKILKVEGKPKRRAACFISNSIKSIPYVGRPHPAKGKIANMVRDLAPKYQLDANLVLAVIEAESNFNPNALSPKNAQGLMQLIPETADRFGVKDAWDPEQNVRGGMAYLRWLLKQFNGDVKLALAGYNAGEGAVQKYGGVPPYKETQNYVAKIIDLIGGTDS